jgi:hypothetical protein
MPAIFLAGIFWGPIFAAGPICTPDPCSHTTHGSLLAAPGAFASLQTEDEVMALVRAELLLICLVACDQRRSRPATRNH